MPQPRPERSDDEAVADPRDAEVRGRLRRDAALVRGHPSTAEGDLFVDAALADLTDWRGLRRGGDARDCPGRHSADEPA